MQHIITWNQYIIYSVAGLVMYYGFIIFRFYRKDILQIQFPKAGKKKNDSSSQGTLFTGSSSNASTETAQNTLSPVVHDFVDELIVLLKQSAAQHAGKIEIIGAIKKLINKYPKLKGSSFQTSITNLIAAESDTNCNVRLSSNDLADLWN